MSGTRSRYNNAAGHSAAISLYNSHSSGNRDNKSKSSSSHYDKKENRSGASHKTGSNITLFPATSKQLLEAVPDPRTPGQMRINGLLLTDVTIVGKVKSVDDRDLSCLSFIITDHTGDTTVKSLHEVDQLPDPNIQVGNLVRIFGSVRSTPGLVSATGTTSPNIHVTAFVIRSVTDTEYEFHKLESDFIRRRMNGSLPAPATTTKTSEAAKVGGNSKKDDVKEMKHVDEKKSGEDSELQAKVTKAMELAKDSDIGMTLEEICANLPNSSTSAVRTIVDNLLADGSIYNTIDNLHFKLS